MQISFGTPANVTEGAWVVGAVDGGALLPAAIRADKTADGALSRALKVSPFKGKAGQFVEVAAPAGLSAARLLLVGLGKPALLDEKGLETLGAQIAARLHTTGDSAGFFEIDVPKGCKVEKGGSRGAPGFRRDLAQLQIRQVPHPRSGPVREKS